MPKTKRDILKRRCFQMLKHTNIISMHIDAIYEPYQHRPETRAYDRVINIQTYITQLESEIKELRERL